MKITGTQFHERSLAAANAESDRLREQVNRYEAAQLGGKSRSYIPALLQDARMDANAMSRAEMARKIRYFRRNLWLVQRLQEIHVKYTVGPSGLTVTPASSDPEYNRRMWDHYCAWCESPALDSLLPMPQLDRLMAAETHVDGEIFMLKTRAKAPGQASVPKIQLIESHRVETPDALRGEGGNRIFDGVEVDATGKPVGYWIRDGIDSGSWVFRPASEVIHVYDPDRVGMYRAVTPYHSVLNTGHDLDDLEMFEMQRAKENAQVANIFETATGELNRDLLTQNKLLGRTTVPTGAPDAEKDLLKRINQYRTVLGARTIAIKTGEKLTQQANQNPSAATQWYWRFKISQVCAVHGTPMLLILPESLQGTIGRAVLDDAHISFRSRFHVYAHAARARYRYFADWARTNVRELADPPHDWWKCSVTPPRAVNVDYGRNSAATIAELAAGITNYDDIAGANGTTSDALLTKKARNVGRIKQIAAEVSKEMGVDVLPAEIAENLANILQKLAAAGAVEVPEVKDEEDEEIPALV